jgi:hypothetical protein
MKLVLLGIYERKDVEEARKLFGTRAALVRAIGEQTGDLLEPMACIARTIKGYLAGNFVHQTQGLTTAFMERLNG